MLFQWDETKRLKNIKKHGVDFEYAALIFVNPIITQIDTREDYGEIREITLGIVDGNVLVVCHTERDGNIRIISAWSGGKKEHDYYYQNIT